jgi:hypothetical protein
MKVRILLHKLFGRGDTRGRRRLLSHLFVIPLIAALLVAVVPGALPALAQGNAPGAVKVLVEDVTESSAADFGRGQARGVAVAGAGERAQLHGQAGEFFSGIIALPFAATHLGLHWVIRGGSPESVAVAVRTGEHAGAWSDWYPLTIEAVAELPAGQEVFAALAPGRNARLAQYRITFGPAEAVSVDSMTVTALNSVSPSRKPVPTPPPTPPPPVEPFRLEADGQSLNVITREGWGCDESLRFSKVRRVQVEKWPEMYVPVKKIIIHHTATSNNYADGAAEVRAIYTYHVQTLRWGDIGYNMLVDRFGNVYEGRHGRGETAYPGREILGDDVVAGHAYAYNYGTTGISAIGNSSEADPSQALLDALVDATAFEAARQHIDPSAESNFLRSDGVWHLTPLFNVAGHNEVNATECPGVYLTGWLETLRVLVAGRLANWAAAPTVTVTITDGDATFTAPDGAETWSLEAWYKVTGEEPVDYLEAFGGYEVDPVYYPADPNAWIQAWPGTAWPAGETKTYWNLPPGHYTMHVRNAGYEGNVTFLVEP